MIRLILTPLFVFCITRCTLAGDNSALISDIKAGQRELLALERLRPHVRCKQYHQVQQKSGNHTFDSYRNGDRILLDAESFRACRNGAQCFFIKRTSLSTPYSLSKFAPNATDGLYRTWTDTFLIAENPLTAMNERQTVAEFLDDRATTSADHHRNADGTIHLNFSWQKSESDIRMTMAGTMIFDPSNKFVLVRVNSTLTYSNMQFPIEYSMIRTLAPGVEHPTTSQFTETYASGGKIIRLVKNEIDYPDSKLDDVEYTLEHYGIATPTEEVYEDRRSNWPLWAGIGVGFLILSVILAWVARRRIRSR